MILVRFIGIMGFASLLMEAGQDGWAYREVSNPELPEVRQTEWAREDLDYFVQARIEQEGFEPAKEASKRHLVRRAYFDLHGLPPSAEQVEAFLSDQSDKAWENLIERLLASPRYGERWGRHWLDVARYSDSNGMDEDIAHPSAWRYRDYVIESFNHDKPFDQFIIEQLAGDLLPAENLTQQRAQTLGLGFLSVGPKMLACDDPDKMRRDIVDEQMDTMGRAFLGMTIGCARCHDHKIDPISIEDYYGLAGVFMSTKTLTKYSVVAEFHEHDLTEKKHREMWAEVARLEESKNRKETPEDEKGRLVGEISRLKKDLPAPFKVMGVTEYPTQDVRVHLKGDYLTLGDLVPRGVPSAWTGGEKIKMPAEQSGRLELARWISSAKNPLTPRVIVNRLWRWHFGRGIVATPDNFGGLGEEPSHPKLLDHLASLFINSGWSVKSMHRVLMNSATYRQSASAVGGILEKDPENQLLARWQRRRVESEVIRDSILFKSGRLNFEMGGSLVEVRPNKYIDRAPLQKQAQIPRRTVYLPVYRSTGYDDQKVFDVADPTAPDGNRRCSTVAGQALFLMNSELIHESSDHLASLVLEHPESERVGWLIRRVLDREATQDEVLKGQEFLSEYPDRQEGWAAFARVLFASHEFMYVE